MSLHGAVHPGGKEAQAAYAETEERLKEEEAIVKELEKQAEFYKEIAKL
jgi:uncharacterized protein YjaG (DUF416 family)